MSSRILPPGNLFDALRPIDSIDDKTFELILDAVSKDCSFHLNSDQIAHIAESSEIDEEALTILLGALGFLYYRCEETEDTYDNRASQIDALLDLFSEKSVSSLDDFSRYKERLASILEKNPVHRRYTQAARLQNGFIPTATEISTFLDVRPSFNSDVTEIDGFIEVIQIGISTNSADPRDQQFTFQLNKSGLKDLKKTIDRLDEKINVLESSAPFEKNMIEID